MKLDSLYSLYWRTDRWAMVHAASLYLCARVTSAGNDWIRLGWLSKARRLLFQVLESRCSVNMISQAKLRMPSGLITGIVQCQSHRGGKEAEGVSQLALSRCMQLGTRRGVHGQTYRIHDIDGWDDLFQNIDRAG